MDELNWQYLCGSLVSHKTFVACKIQYTPLLIFASYSEPLFVAIFLENIIIEKSKKIKKHTLFTVRLHKSDSMECFKRLNVIIIIFNMI